MLNINLLMKVPSIFFYEYRQAIAVRRSLQKWLGKIWKQVGRGGTEHWKILSQINKAWEKKKKKKFSDLIRFLEPGQLKNFSVPFIQVYQMKDIMNLNLQIQPALTAKINFRKVGKGSIKKIHYEKDMKTVNLYL